MIPLIPTAPERILFTKGIFRSAAHLIFLLAGLLLGLEATRGVRVAEAMHMHGLDADARATVPAVGGADVVAGIFFALAPFVECEVLAAHGCFCCMLFFNVVVDC